MFERDKREMPVVDSATPGVSPSAVPFSATASSRKEKKKQAKEERDRLKQAEKKKRRLEKALATAAAIRTELEKKKQRRKEEEQRLDEEGAALAEAVALQVSVPFVQLLSPGLSVLCILSRFMNDLMFHFL